MKPRNSETDEAIRLLAKKLPVREVAERLGVEVETVRAWYVRYYDEIVKTQKDGIRRQKAEELRRLMARPVAAVEPEVTPVTAVEPEVTPVAAVEPEITPVAAVEPEITPVAAVEPEAAPVAGDAKHESEAAAIATVSDVRAARRAQPRMAKAPADVCGAPAAGRLRVCGYMGDCGRVYIQRGGTIEISNLAQRFSKEDLRAFAHEVLEMVRILDKQAVGA